MNFNGAAKVQDEVNDLSILRSTGLRGISAMFGITERYAKDRKPKLVGSVTEFKKWFGGEITDSDFPTYVMRHLNRGAKVLVGSVNHFTDLADNTTLVGEYAKKAVGFAKFTAVFVGAAGNGITIAIAVAKSGTADKVDVTVSLAGYPELTKTIYDITDPIVAAPTADDIAKFNSGNTLIELDASGSGDAVGEILTTDLGAGGADYDVDDTFTINTGTTLATGKVLTVSVGGVVTDFDILTAGAGYTVGVKATTKTSGYGSGLTINILTVQAPAVTYPYSSALTGGAEDKSLIDEDDHIGDQAGGTGVFIFDNFTNFVRIGAPALALPALDDAIVAYVEMRKDCRAILRTPIGIDGTNAIAYRMRTDTWDGLGSVIDNWRASMVYGGIIVRNTLTGSGNRTIHAIGDYMGLSGLKDNSATDLHKTVAGSKRGKMTGVVDVEYNLASPARTGEFDSVCDAGLNPIVNDETYGPVIWNNATLQRAQTLLVNDEVAELLIYLHRAIIPLAKGELFDPNDVETWKNIYKAANPILREVKNKRGLWDYLYQGDQFIQKLEEAVVNSPDDIDSGGYYANIWLKPKRAMKWVGFRMNVVNNSVSFAELTGQPE